MVTRGLGTDKQNGFESEERVILSPKGNLIRFALPEVHFPLQIKRLGKIHRFFV